MAALRGLLLGGIPALSAAVWRRSCGLGAPAARLCVTQTPGSRIHFKLDEKTAHSSLDLFKKETGVIYRVIGVDPTKVPQNPERFRDWAVVLGDSAVTAGRHYWEVTVRKFQEFRIGVADSGMWRGDCIGSSSSSWVFGFKRGDWYSMTGNEMVPIAWVGKPERVGLLLDYDGQKLGLVDLDKPAVVHAIEAEFKSPVCPAFALWDGELVTHSGLEVLEKL
ncbi:SPRY domain-containing protein 4 [Polyodon spathula]|uniref:SPRY domain-containing protein 4 n=1 Tax=Polyodon spathula TaxID=7913 RepID=UPI001B7EF87C|nr:SPRY domain-containing protein 4 [Polyodon spathula]